MTQQLQSLALESLQSFTDLLVQPSYSVLPYEHPGLIVRVLLDEAEIKFEPAFNEFEVLARHLLFRRISTDFSVCLCIQTEGISVPQLYSSVAHSASNLLKRFSRVRVRPIVIFCRHRLLLLLLLVFCRSWKTAGQWLPSLGRRQSTMKNSSHCCKTSLKQPSMTSGRRQLTSKNSGHSCKTSSKQPSMGIMSKENSRGGFPLRSSRFLLSRHRLYPIIRFWHVRLESKRRHHTFVNIFAKYSPSSLLSYGTVRDRPIGL